MSMDTAEGSTVLVGYLGEIYVTFRPNVRSNIYNSQFNHV